MGQMQAMMAPFDGPVNWTLATDVARRTSAQEPDPAPGRADQTGSPTPSAWPTTGSTAPRCSPPASRRRRRGAALSGSSRPPRSGGSWSSPSPSTSSAPWQGDAGGGQGDGRAAHRHARQGRRRDVRPAGRLGARRPGGRGAQRQRHRAPPGSGGKAALLPHNITAFAEGLDVSEDDVVLYLALREAAHQRLFAHVPWLRAHLISSVEDFGRGVTIDVSGIEQAMAPSTPPTWRPSRRRCRAACSSPRKTPQQEAALQRLETTLALVEGWVDEVVGQATAERMPAAAKMQEAFRVVAPPAAPRRRPSRPWSASSSARAGCATPRPCGGRCDRARASRPATPSGPTPTCSTTGRPRRPAGLPRGRPRRGGPQRRGLRQGPRGTPRRRGLGRHRRRDGRRVGRGWSRRRQRRPRGPRRLRGTRTAEPA